jgi:biuret amidohydrolase
VVAVLEFGIASTVRHAADLGYIPVLIEDACYSFSEENRVRSLSNLQTSSLITTTDLSMQALTNSSSAQV